MPQPFKVLARLRGLTLRSALSWALLTPAGVIPMVWGEGAMAQTVELDVEFKVTDREHTPLADRPARLVLGEGNYPDPQSGHRFVTDAKGEARFTKLGVLKDLYGWRVGGYRAAFWRLDPAGCRSGAAPPPVAPIAGIRGDAVGGGLLLGI